MVLSVIIKREVRDTVLSRRYLIYLSLIFIPVGLLAWLVRVLYSNPSALARVGAAYPEPIMAVTSVIALMLFVCGFVTFPALISIIHAGNFIAGDQEKGVLLLLASKPLQRWKILTAKYLSFLIAFVPLIFSTSLRPIWTLSAVPTSSTRSRSWRIRARPSLFPLILSPRWSRWRTMLPLLPRVNS